MGHLSRVPGDGRRFPKKQDSVTLRKREMNGIPETFPINHDDYHAKHIGRTADGRQFFLTTPFVAAHGKELGAEFIALFTFDENGKLLEASIDNLGPRATIDGDAASKLFFTISSKILSS